MVIFMLKWIQRLKKDNCVLVFFRPPLNSSQPPSDYAYLMVVFFFFAPGSLKKTSSPSSVTTMCFLSIDFFLVRESNLLSVLWTLFRTKLRIKWRRREQDLILGVWANTSSWEKKYCGDTKYEEWAISWFLICFNLNLFKLNKIEILKWKMDIFLPQQWWVTI